MHRYLLKSVRQNCYVERWENMTLRMRGNFKTIRNQQKFMDSLFITLHFKSFDDWHSIKKTNIIQNGGHSLLYHFYSNNLKKLFSAIYPNYPWQFGVKKNNVNTKNVNNYKNNVNKNYSKSYFANIKNQKSFMDSLYIKLNLKSLDDWLSTLSIRKLIKHKGKVLISHYYSNNLNFLLTSLYPNHSFDFSRLKYAQTKFSNTKNNQKTQILKLISKYSIQQKKDFYRLCLFSEKMNLFKKLSLIYPYENWQRNFFIKRSKKSVQRLLYSMLLKLTNSIHLLIENYKHPSIICLYNDRELEIDIFIPCFNIAIEYQGEHHFDDLPASFGSFELHRNRDQMKEIISFRKNILLITIPYWWDHSPSSLQSTLYCHFSPFFKY